MKRFLLPLVRRGVVKDEKVFLSMCENMIKSDVKAHYTFDDHVDSICRMITLRVLIIDGGNRRYFPIRLKPELLAAYGNELRDIYDAVISLEILKQQTKGKLL